MTLTAVDVIDVCPLRLGNKWREGARPLAHPIHGHSRQQRFTGTFKERPRFRMLVDKALLLALHQRSESSAIDGDHQSCKVAQKVAITLTEGTKPSKLRSRHHDHRNQALLGASNNERWPDYGSGRMPQPPI